MVGPLSRVLLKAFVVWVGVQLGAGIYEGRIVIPQWSTVPPAEVGAALERSGFESGGLRFWVFVSPPVALLALVNDIFAWRSTGKARPWWLAAAATMALESLATYGYFVPTAFRLFEAESLPPAQVEAMVAQWVGLNPVHMLVGLAALIAAVQALALLGAGDPGSAAAKSRQGAGGPAGAVRGTR